MAAESVEGERLIEGKKLCFGKKYSDKRGGPCRGWTGGKPCTDKEECQKLFTARTKAGVTEDSLVVPDHWEDTLVEVGGLTKNLIHAGEANSPEATTITHEELAVLGDKIIDVEKLAVGQTLNYFCALGRLYLDAHKRMTWREFRTWVEKAQARSIITVLKYEQLARTVDKIGVGAADQLMNKPGLTLDKFIAIVRAVGPENLLSAVDKTVEREDGTIVPVTALPLHRVKKELSPRQKIAKEEADAKRPCDDGSGDDDYDENDADPGDGAGAMSNDPENGQPLPENLVKFNPMPALAHLGNIRRLWRNNEDAIRYGAVTFKSGDVDVLMRHLTFLDELRSDVQVFIDMAASIKE